MKNTKKNTNGMIKTMVCAATLALAGITAGLASQLTQNDPPTYGQGTGGGCIGTYYAVGKMTNNVGLFWLTPPAGTTNGVLKDISGFASPYASTAVVTRFSDQTSWCTNKVNTISFPATSSEQYELVVYINSKTPPPSSTQPLVLQITWH